ncbi:MAG: site-specific integrase [Ignavibacteriales bacterium]|nr:site-specific integrase [Ignavibacteriales bacterium]
MDLKENPVSDIPDLTIEQNINVKFYNKDEVVQILENIDPHWVNYFTFILNTGLRKGEINNLTWENVNINEREIIIASNKDWKTKNRKSRRIKLNNTALQIIMDQIGKNNTYVFAQINGNKINPDRPYQALKRTLKILNLEGDVHKFRHTFGSNYIMRRAGTVYELQQIMGHFDPNVTSIYVHLSDDHQLNSMKKLEEQ